MQVIDAMLLTEVSIVLKSHNLLSSLSEYRDTKQLMYDEIHSNPLT